MKRQMAMLGVLAVVLAAGAKPSFFLPERIFAAPGLELNVYYKNVFDSVVPQNFAYEATCRKGCAELARWCFTPEEADAGKSYELVLSAWNDDGLVASVTSTVVVAAAAADPAKRVTLALLGDSLTNCGFQDQALRMMRGHGYSGYTPVGSRTTGSSPATGFPRRRSRTSRTPPSASSSRRSACRSRSSTSTSVISSEVRW